MIGTSTFLRKGFGKPPPSQNKMTYRRPFDVSPSRGKTGDSSRPRGGTRLVFRILAPDGERNRFPGGSVFTSCSYHSISSNNLSNEYRKGNTKRIT